MINSLLTHSTFFALGAGAALTGQYAWQRLRRRVAPKLGDALNDFFGQHPCQLPVVSRGFSYVDLPNLQLAITRYAEEQKATLRSIGYVQSARAISLLMGTDNFFDQCTVGPLQYQDVDVDVDQRLQCVVNGFHLIDARRGKVAAHLKLNPLSGGLEVEVRAETKERAADFIEAIRLQAHRANVYRRKILSLECGPAWGAHGCAHVRFHRFAPIRREEIILPAEALALIERNTTRFFQHAGILKQSERSVKRGLLFHGKPGTGKTLTARWLAQTLPNVTVLLMTGEQLGLVKECCQMARMLAPALVIMEDVDLIATERHGLMHPMQQISLHQLLNEMDGLTSEAEVIFILTTNRPEVLEPALAARPGRIDQCIEFALPDTDCRRRLFERYGRGLALDLGRWELLVAKTAGASPAFIQELLRKAALVAAEERSLEGDKLCVRDQHVETALRELVMGNGDLTRRLLGFSDGASDNVVHRKQDELPT